jgi:hypothetical protein
MPPGCGRPAARGPHEPHRRSRPSSTGACGVPGISGSHDSPGSRRVVPLLCASGSLPRRASAAHAARRLGQLRIGARSGGGRTSLRGDPRARRGHAAAYGRTGSLRDPARKDGWKTLYPLRVQAYPIRVHLSTPRGYDSSPTVTAERPFAAAAGRPFGRVPHPRGTAIARVREMTPRRSYASRRQYSSVALSVELVSGLAHAAQDIPERA